ncbi:MAG: YdcF family protein, partial [Cyclobacteriaceae bacterium]|nr:YdcF family protein [Cyclobacteriaceae bacterium]
MRWVKRILFFAPLLLVLFTLFANLWVVWSTQSRIYKNSETVTVNDHRVALVLGTSHRLAGGGSNPYFTYRMDRAAELFHKKKIDHFILSGDNRTRYYNEPVEMRKALVARGVPSGSVTLDYAGFRTL